MPISCPLFKLIVLDGCTEFLEVTYAGNETSLLDGGTLIVQQLSANAILETHGSPNAITGFLPVLDLFEEIN